MSKVGWDRYGNHYTALDRDLDQKRAVSAEGYCRICDRKSPCRFHSENP